MKIQSLSLGMIAAALALGITACHHNPRDQLHVSHSKQMQLCHQIKQQLGDLQMRAIPNQGGDMPTIRAHLIQEYERNNCADIENEI